jgi:hypothetical protein
VKKLFAILVALMLVSPVFAIEGEHVRMSYSFPLGTVASATVNSIHAFKAPCDMRLRAAEVYTITTTAVGNATDTVVFTVYDDGVAIQTYNLSAGALTGGTPTSFTLGSSVSIAKDSVIKCSAVIAGDSKAVVTPVVTIHYTPTK